MTAPGSLMVTGIVLVRIAWINVENIRYGRAQPVKRK